MSFSNVLKNTVDMSIMKISDCCSSIIGMLPDPSLPFTQASIIGIFIASAVLIYLVQKDTKKPLSSVIILFFRQLFQTFPTDNKELDKVKYKELQEKITLRWESQKHRKYSDRLRHSINSYVNTTADNNNDESGALKQRAVVFHMEELSTMPWWNGYEVFTCEQDILRVSFPKVKLEFLKVFADFQKGVCKQWRKVELLNGHSCVYPLITNGVINTLNCSTCPATFKALSDSRVLGLSGCAFGSAAFKLLFPDTNYGPTNGETNIRIKCDMVLQTTTKSVLEVSGSQHAYSNEGQLLLYDDSHPHSISISNTKDATAVAAPLAMLTLDLWHPGLDLSEKSAIIKLFTS
uniref:Aspartate beta-hydroxylase domain-containing protein 1-like n=1 Tax=Hirondellea gigas TaxID=1518452 RepID=A0A2P2HYG3_9CRUS